MSVNRNIMPTIRNEDRGASAVTIAFMMVLFMGIAAIAIDLGLGFNERRVDQTGADTGVMAGAVDLVLGGSYQDTVDEVLDYVDNNIGVVPLADWATGACQDPDQLITTAADLGLSPSTECVSFEGLKKIRVKIPTQSVDTAFSQFVGFNSLSTSAAAEALAIQFPGAGNAAPFVALAGTSGGDLICLRTGPGGQPNPPPLMEGNGPLVAPSLGTDPDPCDETEYDPDSEFFGALDPLVYFNNDTGEITCKSNLVEYAIAAGIDHTLSYFDPDFVVGASDPTGPSVVQDDCGPVPVAGVNTIPLKTGLSASELRCGMLTSTGVCATSVSPGAAGGNNVPARLHLGPYVQNTHTFLGERMDNKPMWDFLATPLASWPFECSTLSSNLSNPDWDYFDKKDWMIDCLIAWDDDGPLFSDGIIETPRFAWIPILAESNLTTEPSVCPEGGNGCVHFNDFVPVYMQTLYTLISGGGGGTCDDVARGAIGNPRWGRHDAGEEIDCGQNSGNLDRISAVVLNCGMLSSEICTGRPGTPGGDVTPILELTK